MTQAVTFRDANQVKQLFTRRNRLTRRIAQLAGDPERDQDAYDSACSELGEVNRLLEQRQAGRVIISEHAMLRYLQRVKGLDLDAICREIITDDLQAQIQTLGDGKYPIGNGYRVQVVNQTIVTVIEK